MSFFFDIFEALLVNFGGTTAKHQRWTTGAIERGLAEEKLVKLVAMKLIKRLTSGAEGQKEGRLLLEESNTQKLHLEEQTKENLL